MGPCDNCNDPATTTLHTKVGTLYLCSEECQNIILDGQILAYARIVRSTNELVLMCLDCGMNPNRSLLHWNMVETDDAAECFECERTISEVEII